MKIVVKKGAGNKIEEYTFTVTDNKELLLSSYHKRNEVETIAYWDESMDAKQPKVKQSIIDEAWAQYQPSKKIFTTKVEMILHNSKQ